MNPRKEQRWNVYAVSLLAFSVLSLLLTYLVLRVQGSLPVNPTDRPGVPEYGALNAAVSFMTNTNWQWYSGECAMSHLTQMVALTVQNFVSAAAGMADRRGHHPGHHAPAGPHPRQLLGRPDPGRAPHPAPHLAGRRGGARRPGRGPEPERQHRGHHGRPVGDRHGHRRGRHGDHHAGHRAGHPRRPGGRRRIAIKQLGTNGGGFFNANSSHPFENPNGWTNFIEIYLILLIPFAFPVMFGRMLRQPTPGLGAAGRDGAAAADGHVPDVLRRDRRQPGRGGPRAWTSRARRCRPAGTWRARSPLRRRHLRPVGRGHHRHLQRLGQLHARLASPPPAAAVADAAHEARRGLARAASASG